MPSYEEWQQLHKFLEEFNALDVAKENQQLKELLKECYTAMEETQYWDMCKLLPKIDDALGEE